MSYNLKTLIVFDTNSLRSTEAGEVAYSFFAFGKPYQVLEDYIIEKELSDDIHLAIPSWAIEELKDQKQRQYKTDIKDFQKLAKRLSGLPHIPEIALPEHDDFDCQTYVHAKAFEYLKTKNIKLLEIKEEIASAVLQSMMTRVMKEDTKKAPFASSGKYKDAGFKDNVVWESLMNFEEVNHYDKVIFLTKDGDYKNCEFEFKAKWERFITIEKDEYNVITEIEKDYGNYIENKMIYEYAQKEYFDDYLKDFFTASTHIDFMGTELKIENYKIEEYCNSVEMTADEDGEFTMPLITSIVMVYTTNNEGEKISIPVETKTSLSDKEYMDIQGTTFTPEIY